LVRARVGEFWKAAEELGQTDRKVRELDLEAADAVRRLQWHPLVAEVEVEVQNAILKTHQYLRVGDIRRAIKTLATMAYAWNVTTPREVPEHIGAPIVHCGKTLDRVQKLLKAVDRLPEEFGADLAAVMPHVRRALPNLPPHEPAPDRQLAESLVGPLNTELTQSIKAFWSMMPDLETRVITNARANRTALEAKVKACA